MYYVGSNGKDLCLSDEWGQTWGHLYSFPTQKVIVLKDCTIVQFATEVKCNNFITAYKQELGKIEPCLDILLGAFYYQQSNGLFMQHRQAPTSEAQDVVNILGKKHEAINAEIKRITRQAADAIKAKQAELEEVNQTINGLLYGSLTPDQVLIDKLSE